MRVVLATSNAGKVREARLILEGSGLELANVPMLLAHEETGSTYLDNARLKALAAQRLTGEPVLAEDAGLEVDALSRAPGPRSARFAGPAASDEANIGKLLRLLSGVEDARRSARYRAVAVLLAADGREVVGEGVFEGRIATVAAGDNGFGYDPVFVPAGREVTVAQLDDAEKGAISHRGRALRGLVARARAEGVLP